ncbi:acyl carrier protein [Peptostreptococcus russellii]|uniref:Acyl carrier protein n=1 Tax=Peptostreptococcus russellii TaxID=215200 RepID=A0A1H8FRE6_9FIRM|nr:acyl carrier protein [Peptostreptococcus russellii]MBC2577120.1 acyl carrier protein [Peptostreptococcus russellii]SEN34229.1 acyl carrier protein [Peptostreptococcus russellii]
MFEKIKEIIVDKLNIDDDSFIDLDTDLMEDLNADSLDAVEIIMDIEDEFDITVDEDDVENIRTIADIINYIEEHS